MTPSKLSASVIKKIRERHLHPQARSVVLLRRSLFWIFFALSVFIGAKAIAFTFHIVAMADVPMLFRHRPPPPHMLMQMLPLFWVASFLLFVAAASWCLQHTPKGYKWTLPKILAVNILLSVAVGYAFYATGIARMLDRRILSVIRPGISAEHYRQRLWNNPQAGFLHGMMVEKLDETHFLLRGPRGRTWQVEIGSGALKEETGGSGAWVHIRGEMTGPDSFRAEGVMPDLPPPPFGGPRGMMRPPWRE